MNETDFIERWNRERDMYKALGDMVVQSLLEGLADFNPHCLKLPLEPRLKADDSMLTKAFQRKKYPDPYNQVEDKIGVRAVVLFSQEIHVIAEIVEHCTLWTCKRDRDFEEERRQKPFEFAYQSVHYVIRAGAGCSYRGVSITEGTPCEIQIRTILQHAYSELTHDTIYKPSVRADPDVHRAAAKSMALIEATDDYFMVVKTKLAQATEPARIWSRILSATYAREIGRPGDSSPLNELVIDHFMPIVADASAADLDQFLSEKRFIVDRIQEKRETNVIYRQPSILLVYLSVARARFASAGTGPLGDDELAEIYSDLGFSLP